MILQKKDCVSSDPSTQHKIQSSQTKVQGAKEKQKKTQSKTVFFYTLGGVGEKIPGQ